MFHSPLNSIAQVSIEDKLIALVSSTTQKHQFQVQNNFRLGKSSSSAICWIFLVVIGFQDKNTSKNSSIWSTWSHKVDDEPLANPECFVIATAVKTEGNTSSERDNRNNNIVRSNEANKLLRTLCFILNLYSIPYNVLEMYIIFDAIQPDE